MRGRQAAAAGRLLLLAKCAPACSPSPLYVLDAAERVAAGHGSEPQNHQGANQPAFCSTVLRRCAACVGLCWLDELWRWAAPLPPSATAPALLALLLPLQSFICELCPPDGTQGERWEAFAVRPHPAHVWSNWTGVCSELDCVQPAHVWSDWTGLGWWRTVQRLRPAKPELLPAVFVGHQCMYPPFQPSPTTTRTFRPSCAYLTATFSCCSAPSSVT